MASVWTADGLVPAGLGSCASRAGSAVKGHLPGPLSMVSVVSPGLTSHVSSQGPHSHAHPHGRGAAPGPAAGHSGHSTVRHPWVSAALTRGWGALSG